jgi:hypothetical protein
MRDTWFERLGAGRFTLQERGFLATLYSFGDAEGRFATYSDECAEAFGSDWLSVACNLKFAGAITFQMEDGWVQMQLKFRDAKRRNRNRNRRSQCHA